MQTFIFLILAILAPAPVIAHSIGEPLDLPIPFYLYLISGGGVLAISFFLVGYFRHKKDIVFADQEKELSNPFFRFFANRKFVLAAKALAFFLFVLTIVSGLFGADSAYSNWNMTFFWIIFTLGLTYCTAILGDFYKAINPLRTLTDWVVGKDAEPIFKYPAKLGYVPAVIFYFIFIWVELVGETTPLKLSMLLLAYTIITDIGVVLWGRNMWYKYCEFFSVFFRMVGKLAPLYYENGKIFWRTPFSGILDGRAESSSLLVFMVLMLSSTAFDGFKETVVYVSIYFRYAETWLRNIFGNNSFMIFETLSLALSLFILLGLYILCIYIAKIASKNRASLRELALNFAFPLIPIAFVYHLAHYYTLLFTEAPAILRLASDPFGWGNNFFGTANYYASIILPANFVWHSQVALILLGHIAGVYLTHLVVLQIFPAGKKSFYSQFPMLVLMVSLTLIGLWVLAQPVTGGTL